MFQIPLSSGSASSFLPRPLSVHNVSSSPMSCSPALGVVTPASSPSSTALQVCCFSKIPNSPLSNIFSIIWPRMSSNSVKSVRVHRGQQLARRTVAPAVWAPGQDPVRLHSPKGRNRLSTIAKFGNWKKRPSNWCIICQSWSQNTIALKRKSAKNYR